MEQTQKPPVGYTHFFIVFIIFSSLLAAAMRMYGLPGAISMAVCEIVLALISRTSRKWAWGLAFILVPVAAVIGHVVHDMQERSDDSWQRQGIPVTQGDPALNKAIEQQNISSTGYPAMEPKETCYQNYSEINPGLKNPFFPNSGRSASLVRSMCDAFNIPGNPNREFDRCYLEGLRDSKSDEEFDAWLIGRCNPIYKP